MPVRSIDARSGRLRAEYAAATPQEAGAACRRAADLLPVLAQAGPRGRAALLEAMADALAAVQSAPTIALYSEPHETDLAARLAALARDRTGHLAFDTAPAPPDAAALGRFLRPVTYESCAPRLLPPALRDDNPWRLPRRHDGALVLPAT